MFNDFFYEKFSIQQKEFERHYKVANGGKVVKLKKFLIDFLSRLNVERRGDVSIDKAFVKGLIMGVFNVQTVKANEALDPQLMEFVKGVLLSFPLHCFHWGSKFQICYNDILIYDINSIFTISFITDLFGIRVGINLARGQSFDGLVLAACDEIRKMKPKEAA